MDLAPDAIIFYVLHLCSLPLSLTLIITYFKRFSTISFLSITSLLLSINFILTGGLNANDFIIIGNDNNKNSDNNNNNNDNNNTSNNNFDINSIKSSIQGILTIYLTYSLVTWFICIEIEAWLKIRKNHFLNQQQQNNQQIEEDQGQANNNNNNQNNKRSLHKKLLVIIIGWGIPLILTVISILVTYYANNSSINIFSPWKYYYFISLPAISS
jgi:hypothetical protein